ncbi:MAG TPA: hypothetical protein VKG86_01200 [Terracidiphilus sp.]|nr:hypothetical protein [Terracidiphilus sp.]
MKHCLPVLAIFVGLGCSISPAQGKQQVDPFRRYLADIKANQPEAALVRFAAECGVDLNKHRARYAQAPGDKLHVVTNLAHALVDQETDYYATVAVWKAAQNVLVEYWGLDLELGTQLRTFYCLRDGQIQMVEDLDWAYFEGEGINGPIKAHWAGYEQRWKRKSESSYSTVLLRYVNLWEKEIPKPANDYEIPYASKSFPEMYRWEDLKLPPALLR